MLGAELVETLVDMSSKINLTNKPSGQEESDNEQEAASSTIQAEQPAEAAQVSQQRHDHQHITSKEQSLATSMQSIVDPEVIKVIHEVLNKLFQLIDECPESEEPLSYLHKLQIVDSGGQPQFHEVLPIFLRKMSLIVFVIKLSEQLSTRPTVEYGKDIWVLLT